MSQNKHTFPKNNVNFWRTAFGGRPNNQVVPGDLIFVALALQAPSVSNYSPKQALRDPADF
jgi:hypothetical protein